jgi:hypothetical protein
VREKTSRDKAIEFARQVPKPRVKVENVYSQPSEYLMNDDLNGIEEEPFDEYGNTLKEADLEQLN